MRNISPASTIDPGLAKVQAAATRLSSVDGQAGELLIAGYPLEAFARQAAFLEVAYLLWHGQRPDNAALAAFDHAWREERTLPSHCQRLLAEAGQAQVAPMTALRMGLGALDGFADAPNPAQLQADGIALASKIPTMIATHWRHYHDLKPVPPAQELGHAANFLYMLTGRHPDERQSRGLETYLNTVVDHGLNASTFAARVIISTGTDLASALTGAVGALKGPKHGGAPGPALDTVLALDDPANARAMLMAKLDRGERLMGFGHRVYQVYDPRARMLAQATASLYETDDLAPLYTRAQAVEKAALALLAERKPGHNLQTNVEFYTALLLHGLGIPNQLFSPVFALSRVVGWVAHCREQVESGRIVRPGSIYVGPRHDRW